MHRIALPHRGTEHFEADAAKRVQPKRNRATLFVSEIVRFTPNMLRDFRASAFEDASHRPVAALNILRRTQRSVSSRSDNARLVVVQAGSEIARLSKTC